MMFYPLSQATACLSEKQKTMNRNRVFKACGKRIQKTAIFIDFGTNFGLLWPPWGYSGDSSAPLAYQSDGSKGLGQDFGLLWGSLGT